MLDRIVALRVEAGTAGDLAMVALCDIAADATLVQYAEETAADIGGDFGDAVRAMRDDPSEVAMAVRRQADYVIAWCRAAVECARVLADGEAQS